MAIQHLEVVKATQAHIDGLRGNLREMDKYEAMTIFGMDPDECLQESFDRSATCKAIVLEGVPIGVFGVVSKEAGVGIVWMVGGERLREIYRQIVIESAFQFRVLIRGYRRVENYVWRGNFVAIRWLKWLGFTFEETTKEAVRFYYEQ